MEGEKFYEYERTTAEDTIRLILLQPSAGLEAGIQCSLTCVTLEQCDKDVVEHYVALSYIWGDATARRQISVNGAMLDITASLDCSLRHLRDESRVLRVWADGICINQNDFDDRNQQVHMMSSIYSLARHTIIFLGPGSQESDTVMRLLAYHDHRLDMVKRLPARTDLSLDNKLQAFVDDVLLTNPWFTRVWVLQELVLSADPWVQWGTTRVRWNTLHNWIFLANDSTWKLKHTRHLSGMTDARYKHILRGIDGRVDEGSLFGKPSNTLLELMKQRRGSGASDLF